jgi:hypothetical protein
VAGLLCVLSSSWSWESESMLIERAGRAKTVVLYDVFRDAEGTMACRFLEPRRISEAACWSDPDVRWRKRYRQPGQVSRRESELLAAELRRDGRECWHRPTGLGPCSESRAMRRAEEGWFWPKLKSLPCPARRRRGGGDAAATSLSAMGSIMRRSGANCYGATRLLHP